MALQLLLLIVGFVFLWKGGEWIVEGASGIAHIFRIPELLIGLSLVAFGTSAPELFVNIIASFDGKSDIIFGNILGSNLANSLFILGTAGLIFPIMVRKKSVIREIPFNVFVSLLLLGLLFIGPLFLGSALELSRGNGVCLLFFFVVFLGYLYRASLISTTTELKAHKHAWYIFLGYFLLGLLFLQGGAKLVVTSAISLSVIFHVSEAFISLFVIAIGTSLPELVTTCIAAYKKRPEIAFGNIIGSNIFNILLVLGVSSTIAPITFNPTLLIDLVITLMSGILLYVLIVIGKTHGLTRFSSGILSILYAAYLVFIFVRG